MSTQSCGAQQSSCILPRYFLLLDKTGRRACTGTSSYSLPFSGHREACSAHAGCRISWREQQQGNSCHITWTARSICFFAVCRREREEGGCKLVWPGAGRQQACRTNSEALRDWPPLPSWDMPLRGRTALLCDNHLNLQHKKTSPQKCLCWQNCEEKNPWL